MNLTYNFIKTHNWVEWTAASISLCQTKGNEINLNDRYQMENDTENEIGPLHVIDRNLLNFGAHCYATDTMFEIILQ